MRERERDKERAREREGGGERESGSLKNSFPSSSSSHPTAKKQTKGGSQPGGAEGARRAHTRHTLIVTSKPSHTLCNVLARYNSS